MGFGTVQIRPVGSGGFGLRGVKIAVLGCSQFLSTVTIIMFCSFKVLRKSSLFRLRLEIEDTIDLIEFSI